MKENNWIKAQEHEREYFTSGKNKQWQTPHSLEYWLNFLCLKELEGFGVEIGCGPNGLYNFTNKVVGVDSIDYGKENFILGKAENLPFKKRVDFVICCNTLDHCQDPKTVVTEMLRISNKLIIWTNVFPPTISYLISKFDKTHPYHFDIKQLKQLFRNVSWIQLIQKPIYSWHGKNATLKGKIKLFIASLFGVKGVCLHLEAKK